MMKQEKVLIEKGNMKDLDELETLYNELNDALAAGINYPGWLRGVYPVRESAEEGLKEDCLYVARCNGKIAGTIKLSHKPEEAYHTVSWKSEDDYERIAVVHTLAVHPEFRGCGIGKALMDFSIDHCKKAGLSSIRLDVYEKNMPAIRLYEGSGFEYIATVDLGYGEYGLDWFKLYERLL